MHKLKKTLLIFFITLVSIVVLVIVFISPITKYLVQKYDVKYTGREITMDWAYVNPFTGYIHFSNVNIYEYDSDTVFISMDGLSSNVAMYKLLSSTYEIEKLTLDNAKATIIKDKKAYNFDDLIAKFSSKDTVPSTKPAVHFSMLDVALINASFYFQEKQIPINYFIKEVNIQSKGMLWNEDTIVAKFSFLPGVGNGALKGDIAVNTRNLYYRLATVINKFDLSFIQQYLNQLTNYGTFAANLDADIVAIGSFADENNVTANGTLAFNDFHFGKNKKEDYVFFKKAFFDIDELSPKYHKYLFDTVLVVEPYFKYELYDRLDNIQYMFGKEGAKVKAAANGKATEFNLVIEIANYIKVLSKNFLRSNYKVNRFRVYDANIIYNDYSLSEKFSAAVNPMNISADSVSKNNKRVNLIVTSGIKPYGNLEVKVSINPKDSSDFDMNYHFAKIPLAALNPYTISYTQFPMDRGTLELNGSWHVQNGNIKSTNHLLLIDPRVAKRQRNKNTKWLPLKLGMAFVRERGNVIDYEVPITGNLKNPKFNFHDVIFDVLRNVVEKPLSTPYRIVVSNVETEIEKSLSLTWKLHNAALTNTQIKFVERMVEFLVEHPEATIAIAPKIYSAKEKEYMMFFEAKKKYYLHIFKLNYFAEKDSANVSKMSAKDTMFVKYLDKQNKGHLMLYTIQDKCAAFIDSTTIITKLQQLNRQRKQVFLSYFKEQNVQKQVAFTTSKSVVPYNGFSYYKIAYKGDFPESLMNAYKKMNELNNESPRDIYKKERKMLSFTKL